MTKYQKRELANCLNKLNIMSNELNNTEKITYLLAQDNKHILSIDSKGTKILLTANEAIHDLKVYTNNLFNRGE